ncbi:MAG: VWA domain-containing protein [Bacteroidota bacterium]
MKSIKSLIVFFLFFQTVLLAEKPAPIIFIVDASGSMWGQIDGATKMQIAKDVLQELVGNMPEEQSLGLVAYGHRQKGDCRDVEYLVAADSEDKNLFNNKMAALKPLGKTPLAYSAKLVIDDLRQNGGKATVILVTDGVETCDGDLCQLVKDAKAEGIEFKMHVVGFDLKPEEKANLQCAAEAGGGDYLDAANAEELSDVLNNTAAQTVDAPAANCRLTASKNGALIDGFVKITDAVSGEQLEQKHRTYADTAAFFLPAGKYNVEVTVLGSESRGMGAITQPFEVSADSTKMNEINFSFDAGTVIFDVTNNGEGWDATVRIKVAGETKNIVQGRTYGRLKSFELNGGTYEAEVLLLKIKGDIKQTRTFSINANQADTVRVNIETGIAFIGAEKNGELMDATVNIVKIGETKSVAAARTYSSSSSNPKKFILLPGKYKAELVGVTKAIKRIKKEIEFEVKAGGEVTKMAGY